MNRLKSVSTNPEKTANGITGTLSISNIALQSSRLSKQTSGEEQDKAEVLSSVREHTSQAETHNSLEPVKPRCRVKNNQEVLPQTW